jgi:hypothetical protein
MRPRRRWQRRAVVAAIVLLVVHGAVWFGALWRLEAELAAREQELVAQGWEVTAGPAHWAGWPLAARLDIDGLAVTAPDKVTAWRSPKARFGFEFVRPLWLVSDLAGLHTLRVGGVEVPVQAGRLTLAIRLVGQPIRSELTVRGLRAEGPGGVLAIGRLDLRAANDPRAGAGQVALTVSGDAAEIDLPSPIMARTGSSFGPRIGALGLDASLTGPLPAGPPTRAAATAWRAAGGRLKLDRLSLRWSKLDVTGSAELELDAQLQPAGTGTLRAVGIPETADALVAAGAIPSGTARAVKALTALMARPPDNEVELQLSIVDRALGLARFPIARLPELVW